MRRDPNPRVPREVTIPDRPRPEVAAHGRRVEMRPEWSWVEVPGKALNSEGKEVDVVRRVRAMPASTVAAVEAMAQALLDTIEEAELPAPELDDVANRLLWIAENIPEGSNQRLVLLAKDVPPFWGVTTELARV